MKNCPACHALYPDTFVVCPRDAEKLIASGSFQPGATVRRKYRIEEEIGRGGMGVVYRATHLLLKETRALKLINVQYAGDPRFVERFLAEALITRQMHHPNIVQIEDADETEDGQPFVVMEYVRGENLRALIGREGSVDPSRAFYIASQICAALTAAHQRGILHRDIKPDNILIGADDDGSETVKVVDFGIAKAKAESKISLPGVSTQTGIFVGTPQYCSPEQAIGRKGEELDARTDLYSVGIVLYEMLTGQAPFSADTPFGILQQQVESRPPPPQTLKPDLKLTDAAVATIMKALEKDRTSRYANAEEMRLALEKANQSLRRGRRDDARSPQSAAVEEKPARHADQPPKQESGDAAGKHSDRPPFVEPTVPRKPEAPVAEKSVDPRQGDIRQPSASRVSTALPKPETATSDSNLTAEVAPIKFWLRISGFFLGAAPTLFAWAVAFNSYYPKDDQIQYNYYWSAGILAVGLFFLPWHSVRHRLPNLLAWGLIGSSVMLAGAAFVFIIYYPKDPLIANNFVISIIEFMAGALISNFAPEKPPTT